MKQFVRFDKEKPASDGDCCYWAYKASNPVIRYWEVERNGFITAKKNPNALPCDTKNYTYIDPEYWCAIERPILRDALIN
jgi:hypothetical protein